MADLENVRRRFRFSLSISPLLRSFGSSPPTTRRTFDRFSRNARRVAQGLWAGNESVNPSNTPIANRGFVFAMLKGRPGGFCLKGGDAQIPGLESLYDGPRPPNYNPMKKQGSIILGIGGDNSDWALGVFFEGAMTKGYTSDEADRLVQKNVADARLRQINPIL